VRLSRPVPDPAVGDTRGLTCDGKRWWLSPTIRARRRVRILAEP
jgi:hypothetical protein